jgi:hypothetical protein
MLMCLNYSIFNNIIIPAWLNQYHKNQFNILEGVSHPLNPPGKILKYLAQPPGTACHPPNMGG